VVFQDAGLMQASIRANIALGKPDAEFDEIQEAARLAQIDDFINTLPKRYDYDVGAFGGLLSSGQKQRIAIARALLRNPAILILDEATCHLDLETERRVLDAIHNARRDRTTIIITHRLTAAKLADTIAILDGGRIVEQGNHEELVRRRGAYYSLWRSSGQLVEDWTN
jgi:ABC-type multidrug transport system fused ATPase/permease subunit